MGRDVLPRPTELIHLPDGGLLPRSEPDLLPVVDGPFGGRCLDISRSYHVFILQLCRDRRLALSAIPVYAHGPFSTAWLTIQWQN